jgi:hypothetical protein
VVGELGTVHQPRNLAPLSFLHRGIGTLLNLAPLSFLHRGIGTLP